MRSHVAINLACCFIIAQELRAIAQLQPLWNDQGKVSKQEFSEGQDRIALLRAQINELKQDAIVRPDYTIDWTSSGNHIYYRKREKLGGRPGKVLEYVDASVYCELQKQMANGRVVVRLEKELQRLVDRQDRIAAAAYRGSSFKLERDRLARQADAMTSEILSSK